MTCQFLVHEKLNFDHKLFQLDVIEPNKIRIISNREGLPRETSFYQVTEENPDFLVVHRRSRDENGQNIEADWWMKRKVETISSENKNVRRR